jgi:hypothetical protein
VPAVFRLAVDGLRGLGIRILVGSARAGTEVSFEMPWLQGGRIVRGVNQGDSRPRDFIPRLVDFFMAGRMPLDRLITRYDFADISRAVADATSGAAIKPVRCCRNDSGAGPSQRSDQDRDGRIVRSQDPFAPKAAKSVFGPLGEPSPFADRQQPVLQRFVLPQLGCLAAERCVRARARGHPRQKPTQDRPSARRGSL